MSELFRELHYAVNFIAHWIAVLLYLRAAANLWRIRHRIDLPHFIIFMSGSCVMIYSLISVYDQIEYRPFIWAIGHAICAYTFYYVAKNHKDTYFTFNSQVIGSFAKASDILKAFIEPENEMITRRSLGALNIGETYILNDKVQVEKKRDPFGGVFYETRMMAGGKFGMHMHDCAETCIVDQGCLICPTMKLKKRFIKNESVTFPPYWQHRPYASEFTRLRVYFHEETKAN